VRRFKCSKAKNLVQNLVRSRACSTTVARAVWRPSIADGRRNSTNAFLLLISLLIVLGEFAVWSWKRTISSIVPRLVALLRSVLIVWRMRIAGGALAVGTARGFAPRGRTIARCRAPATWLHTANRARATTDPRVGRLVKSHCFEPTDSRNS
jgi:hypothetical protein